MPALVYVTRPAKWEIWKASFCLSGRFSRLLVICCWKTLSRNDLSEPFGTTHSSLSTERMPWGFASISSMHSELSISDMSATSTSTPSSAFSSIAAWKTTVLNVACERGCPRAGWARAAATGAIASPVASGEAASAWWNARASTADAQNANPAVARACSFSLVKLMHSCSSEFTSNISKPKMSRIPMKNLAWFTPSPSLKRFMLIRTTSHWKTRE